MRIAGWFDVFVFALQWVVKATEAGLGRFWTKLLKKRGLVEPLDLELGSLVLERLLILFVTAESLGHGVWMVDMGRKGGRGGSFLLVLSNLNRSVISHVL